jgi:hypothetical protein
VLNYLGAPQNQTKVPINLKIPQKTYKLRSIKPFNAEYLGLMLMLVFISFNRIEG